jgi:hypothetical protein
MSPHYYNGDELAMNFEERSVCFAKYLLRHLGSQVRTFREFLKGEEVRRISLLRTSVAKVATLVLSAVFFGGSPYIPSGLTL